MELHGVIRQGAQNPPAGSPVVREASPPPARPEANPAPEVFNVERAPSSAETAAAQRRAEMARGGTRLHLDEATDRIVAEIVNTNNEVIKQVPPEDALRAAARFREVVGLIFDVTV